MSENTNNIIPERVVKEYVELKCKLRKPIDFPFYLNENDEYDNFEKDGVYYRLPSGLSDDLKLVSVLILHSFIDEVVSRSDLHELFGWSNYKCSKIISQKPYCNVVTLIREQGGYGGRGYVLSGSMFQAMSDYESKHYPCSKCSNLKPCSRGIGVIGFCSFSDEKRFKSSGCDNGFYDLK